ncbi:MAG TPA: VOC family protein [Urbifossiella sp.]|nr:VOC family protein [Urbifossiella sp.]
MRLDHIAYRVADRDATVKFLSDAFGYTFQAEFDIFFNDEKTDAARCVALEPPEKPGKHAAFTLPGPDGVVYHLAPEVFVSEGTPGSIVGNWVAARGGIGGIHHLAYEVPDVEAKRLEWVANGWGDFTSDHAFKCDDLTQIFTKPHRLTGVIFEFIERQGFGFCSANVKELMKSTVAADGNMK